MYCICYSETKMLVLSDSKYRRASVKYNIEASDLSESTFTFHTGSIFQKRERNNFITLKTSRMKRLYESSSTIEQFITKNEHVSCHLGGNVYMKYEHAYNNVSIRAWIATPKGMRPTFKGVNLGILEFTSLCRDMFPILENNLNFVNFETCFDLCTSGNQMIYMECSECNPNGIDDVIDEVE